MRKHLRTYVAYSIVCFLVWAVILTVVSLKNHGDNRHAFWYVFGGWAIGWLSATIARAVYPPPRSLRQK